MANAPGSGTETLRDLEGTCDWCGDDCHPNNELCVVMSCNRCDDAMIYHQGCLEKFLKKYGFPSNRKVGFPCPKGRGKGTQHTKECPGRIDRSHPIIPKNEDKKKKAMPPPISEVIGKPAAKQPSGKHISKPQQAAKPGLPARKLAHPKPYELSMRFGASSKSNGPVPNAWHRVEGVHLAVREAPTEPDEMAHTSPGSDQPKPANVPVGLVLEEALSKAQRKNLARRKKKLQATAVDGQDSEAGTSGMDGSADLNSLDDWAAAEQQRNTPSGSARGTENLLAGHNKFVTDPTRYLQLLGLLSDDSDVSADSIDEGDQNDEVSPGSTPALSVSNFSDSPSRSCAASVDMQFAPSTADAVADVPVVVPLAVPLAWPVTAQATSADAPALPGATLSAPVLAATPPAVEISSMQEDEASLREALEVSKKQYELEQEVMKQRMLPTGEGGPSSPSPAAYMESTIATHVAAPTPLSFESPQAPTNSPLVIAPLLLDKAPIVLPKPDNARLLPNGGGSPHPNTSLFKASGVDPMQSKAPEALCAPLSPYAPLATNHLVSTVAKSEDEDDLHDLLALCGVVG